MTLKPVLLRTQPISDYAYTLHDDMLATHTLTGDMANYYYLSVG